MSARDQALTAYRKRLDATPITERETYQERLDRERRERWERAHELLPQTPVVAWFPGVEWDVIDFGAPGTSDQYQGDGSEFYVSPPERDFTLWVGKKSLLSDEWEVQYVWRHTPGPPYEHEGTYWRGVEVADAADVGKHLARDTV